MLLDAATLRPAAAAGSVMKAMAASGSSLPMVAEFYTSQIEHPSRVFSNTEEAQRDLDRFRLSLGQAAADLGLVVGAV
jgi:gamma-glutamyl:cysteine ligase YbdK (ATP-grasp superfamily)